MKEKEMAGRRVFFDDYLCLSFCLPIGCMTTRHRSSATTTKSVTHTVCLMLQHVVAPLSDAQITSKRHECLKKSSSVPNGLRLPQPGSYNFSFFFSFPSSSLSPSTPR